MKKEKRSIEPENEKRSIEPENEKSCIMHVQFACEFVSMAQKLYYNAVVEPELRAVLEKHKKNLVDLAYA